MQVRVLCVEERGRWQCLSWLFAQVLALRANHYSVEATLAWKQQEMEVAGEDGYDFDPRVSAARREK